MNMTLLTSAIGKNMLMDYLKKLLEASFHGDAREESYYSTLEDLLRGYADASGIKNTHVTTLPKKTEAGNPDFRIWDGQQHIVGYIEAKDPSVEHLDQIETTEQLKRYLATFPNLILTNFFEFRLYRNGALTDCARIGRPFIARRLKTAPPVEQETEFLNLLEKFFSFSVPKAYDARGLAVELARRTRFLKDAVIAEELRQEEAAGQGHLLDFYQAFRKFLISGLSQADFADLYAQTLTYGLFAARMRSENGFNRKLAYDRIPPTIGILRDVFRFISLGDVPKPLEWMIDDIAEVLAAADVNAILHEYYHEGKGRDPIVHFYETFLAAYDPATRERRGVFYTPEAVVSYIARSVHLILKEQFGRKDGFAGDAVTVLDPAAGTLTFLAEAARLAVLEFTTKYGQAGKSAFIREHVLKRFFAFELMMAPYAVGHLKMSFLLEEMGYRLREDDRFPLYLTNTLDMEELEQFRLPGLTSLSEESRLAGHVKKEQPILAILGNPPYSGHSANASEKKETVKKGQRYTTRYQIEFDKRTGRYELIPQSSAAKRDMEVKKKTWIGELLEYYKMIDGAPLGEKNPKWLQDDYVKFMRFAQWKIDQAGEGVLGFITNHSYLDNPTFRGMRRSLMNSFNEIYILDLHGNSLKKETCPDGSKDENVFDIRQGVAIALMIKKKAKKKSPCRMFHADLCGRREEKYDWLGKNHIRSTDWNEITPSPSFYLFIPRDERLQRRYEAFPKITDISPVNSVGIVTARDHLTIHWTPEDAWNTVRRFAHLDPELARQAYDLGKDSQDWKISLAQKDILDSGPSKERIIPILYRPFDTRYTYYTGKPSGFHCRPRNDVMRHMLRDNMGLIMPRRVESNPLWEHAFCTDKITEHVAVSLKTIDYLFPLYLYDGKASVKKHSALARTLMLFEPDAAYGRVPNLAPIILEMLAKRYGAAPSPEAIFHYIYAVLHAETYRRRYAGFLKMDFPRIPFAGNRDVFGKFSALGKELVDLHLLRSAELDTPAARFQGEAGPVEKIRYIEAENRISLSKIQYIEGVTPEVWAYRIGGYQVCEKWLKDRKGRTLTPDEIKQYCRLVTALQKTIVIQKAIEPLYEQIDPA